MREDTYSKCRISILPKLGKNLEPLLNNSSVTEWINRTAAIWLCSWATVSGGGG